MLGDGCIVYSKTSIIPYFQFIQALQKVNYLMFSFNYLYFVKVYLKDKVALEEVKIYLQLVLEQDHIHFY